MFFSSNNITKSLVAFISFVILACSILPAFCRCHQATNANFTTMSSEHACCKESKTCKTDAPSFNTTAFDNDNCCCKTRQAAQDALLTNSRADQDLRWESAAIPAVSLALPQYFVDRHNHSVRKVASTFSATGPPRYLLYRALLL
jgi:hypothetical protein